MYCKHGASPADPIGCRGIHVPGHSVCLAHLTPPDRDAYLRGLEQGDDINHNGTPFTKPLLNALLGALQDPDTERPRLGRALFDQATFTGDANFISTTFEDIAGFMEATFSGDALFKGATFEDGVVFDDARFTGAAWFGEATFKDVATFERTTFTGYTTFSRATFDSRTNFSAARFTASPLFGPLMSSGTVDLSGAVFEAPVTMEIAADVVRCVRTQWESTATLRLRYATVDLSDAVLSAPVAVTTHPAYFHITRSWRDEESLDNELAEILDRESTVQVASVRGVDAAHLVLTDVDLMSCAFAGAFHLDQVHLEGQCTFARTPAGFHWRWSWYKIWLYRWSRRRTLAEEHHWRAEQSGEDEQSERRRRWSWDKIQSERRRRWSWCKIWLYQAWDSCLGHQPQTMRRVAGGRLDDRSPDLEEQAPGSGDPRTDQSSRIRAMVENPYWLAELEQSHLREQANDRKPDLPRSWRQDGPAPALSPAYLAAIYRQLRKAFEDSKNEPGAADFYYGEMEMRRHDRTETPFSERALLWAYWLLSGYGLRAVRTMGWLIASMLLTISLLMLFGLPAQPAVQHTTGALTNGQEINLKTKPVIPHGAAPSALAERISWPRFERATRTALNSAVFRSAGQGLTAAGTYIEMASRLVEPVLLLLAVLAVRSRIKR